jgi:hypothetical protein
MGYNFLFFKFFSKFLYKERKIKSIFTKYLDYIFYKSYFSLISCKNFVIIILVEKGGQMIGVFNNKLKKIGDDLKRLLPYSQIYISENKFSIYSFAFLQKELKKIEKFNFIFTIQVFLNTLKSKKIKKYFGNKEYIMYLDLFFEVILNFGLEVNLNIKIKEILGKKVYFVNKLLIACLDKKIDENLAKELVKFKPLKIVLNDSSFVSDNDKINFEETIKELSPESDIWVV